MTEKIFSKAQKALRVGERGITRFDTILSDKRRLVILKTYDEAMNREDFILIAKLYNKANGRFSELLKVDVREATIENLKLLILEMTGKNYE